MIKTPAEQILKKLDELKEAMQKNTNDLEAFSKQFKKSIDILKCIPYKEGIEFSTLYQQTPIEREWEDE